MSPLTTHVLDTARGLPAAGVIVTLCISTSEGWRTVGSGTTDADGRVRDMLPKGGLEVAVYRINFNIDAYNQTLGIRGFYPYAEVVFRVERLDRHYHIPLLLSPFGYSTYLGS